MKQFKLLILLLVIGFVGEAQINYLPIKSRYKLIAGLFDSTLHIPSGTTPSLRTGGYSGSGALFYKTSDSTVYVYTGTQWISVKGSGGGGSADSTVFATLYRVDTAKVAIRLSIAGKLNISDTAALVAGYTRLQRFTDSLAAHTTRFNGVTSSLATKLNISDTANMRPRLYAGSNVTITGTYPNLTIASTGGGSSDTSTFIVDTTYNRLAYAISDDSLWLKSIRIQQGGVDVTPTVTDSTVSWNLTAGGSVDTTSLSNRINLKLSIADTANMLLNYVRRQELKDTAAAIRSVIGGGGGSPAGNYGNIQINRNGAFATPASDSLDFDAGLVYKGNLTGSNFYYAGASLYPYMTLSGSDPLIYFGGTGAAWPSIGRSGGVLSLSGSNTAKRVNINSYLSGPNMVSFYDNGTSRSATFLKTSIYVDTIIGGLSDGSIMGNAYIGDSTSTGTGNSGHMFRAIARQGYNAASLNTYYSTVKMGNNNAAATQGHSVSFQHDAFKFGSNTQDISYGAAFLGDLVYGGIVNKRYGLAHWDAYINTGGGAKLGIQATIKIEKLKAAIGLNAHILADSSDYAQLDGNMYLGDSLHASGARKAFHWFNGTAPSSNISGAIVWAEGGELKARDSGGNVTVLTDAPGTTYNSATLTSFTAGAGFVSDTAIFTDSTLYGSFFTDQDSFYITRVVVVMKGQSGDTLGIQVIHNDSINVTGTVVNGATIAVNSRTTGNVAEISTNQGIPPNSWVWLKSPTVIAGKRPEYLSVTLIGYRKYIAP